MEYAGIVLNLLDKIRDIPAYLITRDPIAAIPTGIIQSLLHQTNILAAEIHINVIESSGEIKKVIKGWNGGQIETCNNKTLPLSFSSPYTAVFASKIDIGKIIFYSNNKFSDNHLTALRIFCKFVSEYIAFNLIHATQYSCNSAYKKLVAMFETMQGIGYIELYADNLQKYYEDDEIEQKLTYTRDINRIKAGSIICKLVRLIFSALKPYSIYYCTFNDGKVFVEYLESRHRKTRNKGNLLNKGTAYLSTNIFLQRIMANDAFWHDELPFIPTEQQKDSEDERWSYLCSPIVSGDSTIGVFIAQYKSKRVLGLEHYVRLLTAASKLASNQTRYLFQRRYAQLVINPHFKGRDTKIEDNKVFVLMPFNEEWSKRIWEMILKPTIIKANFNPVRADDLFGHEIMEDIWKGILTAKVVLADITGRNPNVFYELGIAHALGKDVIIITQNIDDIPFDLKGHRCISYSERIDGCKKLELELFAHLSNRCNSCEQ